MADDRRADGLEADVRISHGSRDEKARRLNKHAHDRIGANLRAMYDSVVQQPIPSRFSSLIAQLEDPPVMPPAEEI